MRNVLFGLILIATPVWAGPMCYTSTAQEDAVLADAAQRENTTPQALIDKAMSSNLINRYVTSVNVSVGVALENQWPTMTNVKKTNICTQLGVSPCPP